MSASPYDRLLIGSPLRRPGVAIAASLALALLLALVSADLLKVLHSLRGDTGRVFFTALAISTLLSTVPIGVLWYLDRRERETPWLFAAAFLWGAFIATGLAVPINNAFLRAVAEWVAQNPLITQTLGEDAPLMIGAPISGPIVEELTKGLGLLLLFFLLRAEFDNMRDGFVYGALIGAGFNWFESALYVAQAYAQYGIAPWGLQLGSRYALFGLSGHAMFTGIFGAFLGYAMQTRRGWLKVLAPVVGLALAVAAHALNNVLPLLFALSNARAGNPPPAVEAPPEIGLLAAWLQASITNLLIFLPFVLIMGLVLWRSGHWERRVIREELADEPPPIVLPGEYAQIRADRAFRTRRIDQADHRHSCAIVAAQNELAFRKRRVKDEGAEPDLDPLVAAWRTEIQRLRALEG